MEWTDDQINRISKLVLTASDQMYGQVWEGLMLAPINNMGSGAVQPFDTPSGFYANKIINDPTTGFRLGSYVNIDTNEIMLIPNGTDGWTIKDWASNGLYTGHNQWQHNAEKVFTVLREHISTNPDAMVYLGGQSLGGAHAKKGDASIFR